MQTRAEGGGDGGEAKWWEEEEEEGQGMGGEGGGGGERERDVRVEESRNRLYSARSFTSFPSSSSSMRMFH